jgi:hypothetical protein
METITPWLTPALVVALGAWLRADLQGVNKRLDRVSQEIGDLRERMARLEGALEGFLAGRRDRDAA